MKKTITTICVILLVLFLLIPMPSEVDDGGTIHYVAPLYSVTKQNTIGYEEGVSGIFTGTVVRVLFFEVYNDVVFVPDDGPGAELPDPVEI